MKRIGLSIIVACLAGGWYSLAYASGDLSPAFRSQVDTGITKPLVCLIPGMGTDHRVFDDYQLEHGEILLIRWVDHQGVADFSAYASGLLPQIDTGRSVILVGVSMGGMIASELQPLISGSHLILISSAKSVAEIPGRYQLGRILPLHKMMNERRIFKISNWERPFRDIRKEHHKEIYRKMLRDTDADFFTWQIDRIIKWDRKKAVEVGLHIQGSEDKTLPLRKIENATPIPGGSHKMVVNDSDTLCHMIDEYIRDHFTD